MPCRPETPAFDLSAWMGRVGFGTAASGTGSLELLIRATPKLAKRRCKPRRANRSCNEFPPPSRSPGVDQGSGGLSRSGLGAPHRGCQSDVRIDSYGTSWDRKLFG